MDSALILATLALTTVLSQNTPPILLAQQNNHNNNNNSAVFYIRLSLGLSFGLLALNILDITPSSWNLFITTLNPTLTRAYQVILWSVVVQTIVLGPFQVGSRLMQECQCLGQRFATLGFPGLWILHLIYCSLRKTFWIIRLVNRLCHRRQHQQRLQEILPLHTSRQQEPPVVTSPTTITWTSSVSGCFRRLGFYTSKFVGGALGVCAALGFLHIIGPWVIAADADSSLLAQFISALSAIGILVSSLLNGFGSVSMPFSYLKGHYLQQVPLEAIATAEMELEKARSTLAIRRSELASGGVSAASASSWGGSAGAVGSNGIKNSLSTFTVLGNAFEQRKRQLKKEIQFLQILISELTDDIAEMREAQTLAAVARTPMGKIRSFLGVVVSVVLLIRLMDAFYSIWSIRRTGKLAGVMPLLLQQQDGQHQLQQHLESKSDVVTAGLLWLTGHNFVAEEYYDTLSQLISLILTAVLSFTQCRTFIRTMCALNRRLSTWYNKCYPCGHRRPREGGVTTIEQQQSMASTSIAGVVLPHLAACLMTCFCLACSIMTKKMLPAEYRTSFSEAVGSTTFFRVHMYTIHVAFSTSAILSAAILGGVLGIQRQNTYRYKLCCGLESWSLDRSLKVATAAEP